MLLTAFLLYNDDKGLNVLYILNMAFELPSLPYEYNALEPIMDEQTMHLHHEKHHASYVDKLNSALQDHEDLAGLKIEDLLGKINEVPEDIRNAVRNHGGGHANHTLFWEILRPMTEENSIPEGKLADAINTAFGNYDSFVDQFTKAATTRFGSGWAWLVVNNGKLEVTDTANQDSPLMEDKRPILGLDVWEHAYYLKYQNRRPEYVQNFWKLVNWPKVEEFFIKASGAN